MSCGSVFVMDVDGFRKASHEGNIPERLGKRERTEGDRRDSPKRGKGTGASSASGAAHGESKGRGRGGHRGRGGREDERPRRRAPGPEDDAPHSIGEALELHRRGLVRLFSDKRDQARCTQFIIEIPDEEQWAPLRKLLGDTPSIWRGKKPSSGAHPNGALHEILSKLFIDEVIGVIEATSEAITAEQKTDIAKDVKYLRAWERPRPTRGGSAMAVSRFQPLGRRDIVPQGVWRWVLSFDLQSRDGRDSHENTADSWFRYGGLAIRPDRGPMDGLERALQTQLRL